MEVIELSREQYIPLPLYSLDEKLKKMHSPGKYFVEKLIDNYLKENTVEAINLNNLILKMMETDINMYQFTEEDRENFYKQLEKLDEKFSSVNKILQELTPKERKKIWLEKFEKITENLIDKVYDIKKYIFDKENVSDLDFLFFSYYLYYIKLMQKIKNEIKDMNENKFDKKLPYYNIVLIVYSPVLLGYFQEKLKKEVLIERLSEIAIFLKPYPINTTEKVENILNMTEDIAPCPL